MTSSIPFEGRASDETLKSGGYKESKLDEDSKHGSEKSAGGEQKAGHWALELSFGEMIACVEDVAGQLGQVKEVMESIRDGSYEADPGETVEMEVANMAGYLDSMGTALHFMGVRLMLLEEYR